MILETVREDMFFKKFKTVQKLDEYAEKYKTFVWCFFEDLDKMPNFHDSKSSYVIQFFYVGNIVKKDREKVMDQIIDIFIDTVSKFKPKISIGKKLDGLQEIEVKDKDTITLSIRRNRQINNRPGISIRKNNRRFV